MNIKTKLSSYLDEKLFAAVFFHDLTKISNSDFTELEKHIVVMDQMGKLFGSDPGDVIPTGKGSFLDLSRMTADAEKVTFVIADDLVATFSDGWLSLSGPENLCFSTVLDSRTIYDDLGIHCVVLLLVFQSLGFLKMEPCGRGNRVKWKLINLPDEPMSKLSIYKDPIHEVAKASKDTILEKLNDIYSNLANQGADDEILTKLNNAIEDLSSLETN